jgi:hypothetical protein
MEPLSIQKIDLTSKYLGTLDLSSFVSTPFLIIVFVIFALLYVLVSCILVYHWSKYGMRSPGIVIAEILFLFVSLALFWFASLAILYY